MFGGFDHIQRAHGIDVAQRRFAAQVPAEPVPDQRMRPVHEAGNDVPVQESQAGPSERWFVVGGETVKGDVGLRNVGLVGRPGQDADLAAGLPQCIGQTKGIGSHAAQALLWWIFVGDQANAHV